LPNRLVEINGNKLFSGGYMSGDCQREMTLQEWVERLPECHSARKEYAALKAEVEKFASTNKQSTPCRCHCGMKLVQSTETGELVCPTVFL
jgi:hypothetical protein